MENAILGGRTVDRIAAQSRARRHPGYDDEVRRLLTAALTVMRRAGTGSRARVADIVAEAGLSNQAFYRHFPSKEALVEALVEDGTLRLGEYLAHRMSKHASALEQVGSWVEGMMRQTGEDVAATTLAVLSNAGYGGAQAATGRHLATVPLAGALHRPFTELGCRQPQLMASLLTHALLGRISDHVWAQTRPDQAELRALREFAVAAAVGPENGWTQQPRGTGAQLGESEPGTVNR